MAQCIQAVFREIKDIIYPNNCVICNKYVEESQNCGASKITGISCCTPQFGY